MSNEISRAIADLAEDYLGPAGATGRPGGAIAVVAGDELQHLGLHGCANPEFNIPWTAETRYPLASITKLMVADAFLTLFDADKVSPDDELTAHLPEWTRDDFGLRLRHLLSMSSGLWHDEVAATLCGASGDWTNEALFEILHKQPKLQFEPGSFQIYNCGNYRLLARILSRLNGSSFADAMRELVFTPSAMQQTLVVESWSSIVKSRATLYAERSGQLFRQHERGFSSGDGAVVSTLNDLVKYLARLTRQVGGSSRLDRLADEAPVLDGLEPRYGWGVELDELDGRTLFGHGGSTNTRLLYSPDLDVSVLCLVNTTRVSAEELALRLMGRLLELKLGVGCRSPVFPKSALGTYGDPDSGLVLELTSLLERPAVRVLGQSPALMQQTHHLGWRSVHGISPLTIKFVDENFERLMVKESPSQSPKLAVAAQKSIQPYDVAELAGFYVSDHPRSLLTVIALEDGLELIWGEGTAPSNRKKFLPLCDTLYHCDGTSLRVIRQGSMNELLLSRHWARDIRFRPCSLPTAHSHSRPSIAA
jgi:CubicO group peptidase (beta-lactamase class C family)